MNECVLSGVRVLEIGGGIAAAFAGHLLAGFGADVVRSEGPPGALTNDEEVYLLPGKRRVTTFDTEVWNLALAADILVEDGGPGSLERHGIDIAELRAAKPSLVIVSISPFGVSGPYAAYRATNLTAMAMGGIMSITGSPNREPLVNGGSQALYLGGLHAFSAAVTAYFGALMHDEGDHIDISLQEIMAGMLELYGPGGAYNGTAQLRMGNHTRAVWGLYPCADGFAGVCALERQVHALLDLVGDPVLHEARFRDPWERPNHDDELQAIMYGWFLGHTKQEILALSPIHKVPFGAVLTPADLLANDNLDVRGFWDRVDTAQGTAMVPGRPIEGLPWQSGELHGPGADTDAVLRDWLGVPA